MSHEEEEKEEGEGKLDQRNTIRVLFICITSIKCRDKTVY